MKEAVQCSNGHKICRSCQLEILAQEPNEYEQEWNDDYDDAAHAAIAAVAAAAAADDDEGYLWRSTIALIALRSPQQNANDEWRLYVFHILGDAALTGMIRDPSWLRHFRRHLLEVALSPETLQTPSALRAPLSDIELPNPIARYLRYITT